MCDKDLLPVLLSYHDLLAVLWPCLQYVETISSRQMDMQKFIADGCREALLEEKRRFCFLADKHCMFSYQISSFHEKVIIDWYLILHSRTPPLVDGLIPALFLSLLFPGQRDAVREAPQLAGKVLRHHQSARHGDEHDRRSVHPSRPITAGWTLQQSECPLVMCDIKIRHVRMLDEELLLLTFCYMLLFIINFDTHLTVRHNLWSPNSA